MLNGRRSALRRRGVLNLSGGDDCLILDESALRSEDLQISLAALWKGGSDNQELIHFGDDKAYISFTPSNKNGKAELILTDGNTTEKLTAPASLSKGEWSRITVRIIGGKATLLINGQVADSREATLTAADVMSASEHDTAVIGKGFRGAVDYVQLSFKETPEPDITYSGSETPDDGAVRGDVDANGRFEAADLVLMSRWLVGASDARLRDWKAGDLCEDGRLDTFDLCLMRELIVAK